MRWAFIALSLGLTLGSSGSARAEDPAELTPAQIARRALDQNLLSATNARAEVKLEVSKKGKVTRERRILTKVRRKDDRTASFVEFLSPADVAGTRFLSVDEGDKTQQYVFLPAFKKVKRVVGAQRERAFMGTDFSYRDLEGGDVDEATWTRLADAEVGGQAVYVVEGTPKPTADVAYGRSVLYVHKKHLVPMRIDFFEPKSAQTLKKRFTVRRLEKSGKRWLATDSIMATEKKKTATRMRLLKVTFDAEFEDADFTRAALER